VRIVFFLNIVRNKKIKTGWRIQVGFKIGLHKKDLSLLQIFQNFFGVGNVYKQGVDSVQYMIQTVKELELILNHLDKYPVITAKKYSDLLL